MKSVAEEWDSRFESTHHSLDFFGASQSASQKQINKLEYSQDVESALEKILGKQALEDVRREGFVIKNDVTYSNFRMKPVKKNSPRKKKATRRVRKKVGRLILKMARTLRSLKSRKNPKNPKKERRNRHLKRIWVFQSRSNQNLGRSLRMSREQRFCSVLGTTRTSRPSLTIEQLSRTKSQLESSESEHISPKNTLLESNLLT